MTNPNSRKRLRKSSQQQLRRSTGGLAGSQRLFGDPNTESFSSLSARMEATRRGNDRIRAEGALGGQFGGNGDAVTMATGRPRDPMFYWRQNNIPFDFTKPEEQRKIREFCRLLYMTHPVIAACVDIYSKLPLQGMHVECKDEQ